MVKNASDPYVLEQVGISLVCDDHLKWHLPTPQATHYLCSPRGTLMHVTTLQLEGMYACVHTPSVFIFLLPALSGYE